ncbi:TolC family protein [Gemmatimonas groenlandica]|uniref:TolC family protein n=1 Tax=Gemmatimonas groenlandica TaxID=2732249 RepID=A0A6M4IMK9_9BACT|nr:TolC family protein [Gemmatimonas groenlandica]QJR36264.1 TolC family protein [Gemmatimonas groenlandica]
MNRRNRVGQTVVGVVIFGAVVMTAPLGAQGLSGDDGARPVSLREAIELAAKNSPAAVSARGLDRNASAARRQALGSYVPNVNLTAGTGRTQGTTINNFNGQLTSLSGNPWSYNNGLALNVEVFDGGRRWSEIKRIRATADVADVSAVSARFDASLQVKQQFYAALAARESAAAAKAQLEQAEQQLKASTARLAAGVATKSDSLRSAILVGNARLAVLTAENDLRVATASLTRVAGSTTPITASPSDTLDTPMTLPTDEELAMLANDGPAVRLAISNVAVARAAKRSQKSTYLPTLTMSYNYAFSQNAGGFAGRQLFLVGGNNASRQTMNFNIAYQLFNGFQRESQTVQADVTLTNAEAQLRDVQLGARQNLTSFVRSLQNAQARVQVQLAAIAASEEDLRVQQQRYALGASTLLDLLTSQTQLNQARQALIQARLDGRIARAQLSSLVGREL